MLAQDALQTGGQRAGCMCGGWCEGVVGRCGGVRVRGWWSRVEQSGVVCAGQSVNTGVTYGVTSGVYCYTTIHLSYYTFQRLY